MLGRRTREDAAMTLSKFLLALTSALCALLALACSTTSEAPAAPAAEPVGTVTSVRKEAPGSLAKASELRATATVETIDHTTRAATLRLADGRVVRIKASDQIRNFDQVKAGDQVVVTYFESVVIQVRPAGQAEPGIAAAGASIRAAQGQLPAAAELDAITLIATVQQIDRATQTVTLESREGTRHSVHVNNPAQFDHVSVGDTVEVTFSEALMLSVERPVVR
jgi:hypothetical protein